MSHITLSLRQCLTTTGLDGDILLRSLKELPNERLPLQDACTRGGIVDPGSLAFSLLGVRLTEINIEARVAALFDEVVGGCNCHDDPVANAVYAVLVLDIARGDGSASVRVSSESDAGPD